MKKLTLLLPLVLIAASGCSKTDDYTPNAGDSGETIFQTACIECHQSEGGPLFNFSKEEGTTAAIGKKINEGNMMMPAFPGIKGESLEALSKYVLEKSNVE